MTVVEIAMKSDIGCVRQVNEDYGTHFTILDKYTGVILADGMGGHLAGDVASKMAVEVICHEIQSLLEEEITVDEIRINTEHAIKKANDKILDYASRHQECAGMGTTVVVGILRKGWGLIAYIGDSRAYQFTLGHLKRLTDDHSLVNELVKSGQITAKEADDHPQRNVLLRALGTDKHVTIDFVPVSFQERDIFLICSDGLTKMVPDKEIEKILNQRISLQEMADQLVERAKEAGGDDNITVILLRESQPNG
ncbi:Stp1/IreP family PP2C-type Ser/Thr phosphatase [Microaerobacter geothermalis]|uniref:Stp1/IreP family PP2C-type Ser/Thr phosphatase n=1 Tax=Microaerobacter geothermalis TaxID=674972 RepID=UPI001F3F3E58|nr:Stp1/IreP family PP2C-type Ser/Thr phosphatase [Microaerobacter geothermalis]MCF6094888.1 Stp1/IreP family PP2C-type Ser/Thr phosphatase [Microaerobacter geothermalis]